MTLSVRRLRNVFVASADMLRSSRACAQLESSIRASGIESLAAALDEVIDPADSSVWIIRNLRVSFAITDSIGGAKAWSRGIATGIQRLIRNGPDGHNAIRFPDRASYWACFLRDLAYGSSERWWYEPLRSLQHLDFGTACVTLLSRKPDLTSSVLTLLMESSVWPDVIRLIHPAQAAALLDFISIDEELPAIDLLESAAQLWPWATEMTEHHERRRLTLTVLLLQVYPARSPAQARGAVHQLERACAPILEFLTRWPERSDLQELVRALLVNSNSPLPLPLRIQLQQVSTEILQKLIESWISKSKSASRVERAMYTTEFGGWFLLLPAYVALGVDILVEEKHRPILRWTLARLCLGLHGRAAPADDAGLLWSADLGKAPGADQIPAASPERLARWLQESGFDEELDAEYFAAEEPVTAWAPIAAAVLRTFAHQLPGFGTSSARHLAANILDGRTSLRFAPKNLDVYLMRRPLDIVLRMAGMDGLTYQLPWRDDATITIHLD